MKIPKRLMLVAFLVPGIALSQSVETRKLPAFTTVQSGGSFDIYIDKGSEESVRIETGSLDPRKIITEVEDGNLKVYLEEGNYSNNIRAKIFLTYKGLSAISQAGSGKMECRSDLVAESFKIRSTGSGGLDIKGAIKAKELEIMLGGSGETEIRSVDVHHLSVTVSGSGVLTIVSGNTEDQRVSVSGSGGLNAFGVQSDNASVSVKGSGSADITVDDSLSATVTGSGSINYKGGAQVKNVVTSGSGRVRKM